MERAAGIEPAPSAWKAEVLPLNYARLTRMPEGLAKHPWQHCLKIWWRGKDSNLRSFRGRFTVCSLWPLGNLSSMAAYSALSQDFVKHYLIIHFLSIERQTALPDRLNWLRATYRLGTRSIVSKQHRECKRCTYFFQRNRTWHIWRTRHLTRALGRR